LQHENLFGEANKTKAASEVLPPSKPPHRPGTAPALGLRAGGDGLVTYTRPPT